MAELRKISNISEDIYLCEHVPDTKLDRLYNPSVVFWLGATTSIGVCKVCWYNMAGVILSDIFMEGMKRSDFTSAEILGDDRLEIMDRMTEARDAALAELRELRMAERPPVDIKAES